MTCKRLLSIALAFLLTVAWCATSLAEEFDPSRLLDWYDEEETIGIWMTVNNDHWNQDISTAPTDEELEKMFKFALKSQTGVCWTETFFLVVRDPAAQQGIIGDTFGTLEGSANEGTVTVLVLVDNILEQDQHALPYDNIYFSNPVMASFNAGMTCGMLNVAATTLGYSTHYFAYPDGALINGAEHDMSYFLEGNDYTRLWGFTGKYDDESTCTEIPVEGNHTFVAAIVIGKPNVDEDVATYSTLYARPDNYAFWD
ncbi:MAG: hypothetical protein ACOYI7_03560 [Candidatus Excrementavichristensenella sp.]